ncbi:MAG: hypothetical protein K2X43_06065 [Hyphomonadaceae bacterium]|nr:hypothetical protein [Hyphomonadaceae bacterium]
MTQARSPGLYAGWGVPDTPEGRFEIIALHLVLILRRLALEGDQGAALGQALTEVFVVDLDDTLREMTVGDLAVPRHVKHAVAALHDRYSTYGRALQQNELLPAAVEARLATLSGAGGLDVAEICAYITQTARALELQPGVRILGGDLEWPQIRMP